MTLKQYLLNSLAALVTFTGAMLLLNKAMNESEAKRLQNDCRLIISKNLGINPEQVTREQIKDCKDQQRSEANQKRPK